MSISAQIFLRSQEPIDALVPFLQSKLDLPKQFTKNVRDTVVSYETTFLITEVATQEFAIVGIYAADFNDDHELDFTNYQYYIDIETFKVPGEMKIFKLGGIAYRLFDRLYESTSLDLMFVFNMELLLERVNKASI